MLNDLIKQALDLKEGDKEFALFHNDGEWMAMLGNPTSCVALGETEGEFNSAWHPTAEQAVSEIISAVQRPRPPKQTGMAARVPIWSSVRNSDEHCIAWECHLAAKALAAKRLEQPAPDEDEERSIYLPPEELSELQRQMTASYRQALDRLSKKP